MSQSRQYSMHGQFSDLPPTPVAIGQGVKIHAGVRQADLGFFLYGLFHNRSPVAEIGQMPARLQMNDKVVQPCPLYRNRP